MRFHGSVRKLMAMIRWSEIVPRRSASALGFFGMCVVGYLAILAEGTAGSPLIPAEAVAYVFACVLAALLALATMMLTTRRERTFRYAIATHIVISWLMILLLDLSRETHFVLAMTNILPLVVYERYPLNLILCGAYTIPTTAMVFLLDRPDSRLLPVFLLVSVALSFLGCLMNRYRETVVSLQGYVNRLEDNVSSLTRANFLSQDYARDVEEESRKAERLRLTRDIHDAIGYTLTNNIMMMEAVKVMVKSEPELVPEYVENLRKNTEQGMGEIRRILRDLRSEELTREPVFRAVGKLVKVFSMSTGMEVHFEFGNARWENLNRFDDCVYHFIQEGLINAFRHGRASHVTIFLWDYDSEIRVSVSDDGVGSVGETAEGIGIAGMRERAERWGGRVEVDDYVGGFRISMYLPNTKEE